MWRLLVFIIAVCIAVSGCTWLLGPTDVVISGTEVGDYFGWKESLPVCGKPGSALAAAAFRGLRAPFLNLLYILLIGDIVVMEAVWAKSRISVLSLRL